jgi:hypothetical protein
MHLQRDAVYGKSKDPDVHVLYQFVENTDSKQWYSHYDILVPADDSEQNGNDIWWLPKNAPFQEPMSQESLYRVSEERAMIEEDVRLEMEKRKAAFAAESKSAEAPPDATPSPTPAEASAETRAVAAAAPEDEQAATEAATPAESKSAQAPPESEVPAADVSTEAAEAPPDATPSSTPAEASAETHAVAPAAPEDGHAATEAATPAESKSAQAPPDSEVPAADANVPTEAAEAPPDATPSPTPAEADATTLELAPAAPAETKDRQAPTEATEARPAAEPAAAADFADIEDLLDDEVEKATVARPFQPEHLFDIDRCDTQDTILAEQAEHSFHPANHIEAMATEGTEALPASASQQQPATAQVEGDQATEDKQAAPPAMEPQGQKRSAEKSEQQQDKRPKKPKHAAEQPKEDELFVVRISRQVFEVLCNQDSGNAVWNFTWSPNKKVMEHKAICFVESGGQEAFGTATLEGFSHIQNFGDLRSSVAFSLAHSVQKNAWRSRT